MSKAIELAEKLDRQLTMSMFAKREDLYAQMAQDREDAAIAIKSLIAQLEAAQAELAAIRALEPKGWLDEEIDAIYTASDIDGLIPVVALPEQK